MKTTDSLGRLAVSLMATLLLPFGTRAEVVSGASSSADIANRTLQRRATEVTIWSMPAVSMAAVRKSLKRDLDADFGDIIYFSNVAEPRHEVLTGNNQTPYVITILDLRHGPMVLDVPPASAKVAFFGSAIDSWEVPLADIGPAGEDAGKGGKYVFLPPGFEARPPAGYIAVPSATVFIHVALRPIASSKGTLKDAVAYSQLLKAYPLAVAANPPGNRYVDAYPHAWKQLPTFDLNFLGLLAEVIDAEPPQPKDAVMLAMLASIGIEKGKAFNPDPARAEILAAGVREGAAFMNDYFLNRSFEAFWPERQWQVMKPQNNFGFSYYGDGKLDYDLRGGGFAYWATWAPKRLADPNKLPASFYLSDFRDNSGAVFRGDRLYRLRVPADTPAHDFWSIIAYENGTNAFIHNPQNRVGVSSYDKKKMKVNKDGSVDVYIGPSAPKGLTNNWIPTAGKNFWLMARFYGPQQALFEKVWKLPDAEEVKQ